MVAGPWPLEASVNAQPPPRQIIERAPPFTHMEVRPGPPGMVMLVILDKLNNELHSYPLATEYAEELGRELTAPRVVMPGQNGHA